VRPTCLSSAAGQVAALSCSCESLPLKHLVLFDIDGTLLWPDGAGRVALKSALERVYGTAGTIDAYNFGGRTDKEITRDVLGAVGLSPTAIWGKFHYLSEVMVEELTTCLARGEHNIQPCPGGPALVEHLSRREDMLLGLLTGNLPETAHIKLRHAGYDPALFRVGAYGDDSAERTDLPPLAVERSYKLTNMRFGGKQVVIIGDTPADVACGRGIGARSIAVLTGWNTRAELDAARPDYLFDDLTDHDAVVGAIIAPSHW
jgi:phosphoglycolate phosphatase